jgi:protein phosphatase
MRFLPGNAQHIGARSAQQDSFGFSDPEDRPFVAHAGIAAVVADGMGGLANGSAASSAAVQAFLKTYESKDPDESVPDALFRAIESANLAVTSVCRKSGGSQSAGTTLAAVAVHQDCLYWVSAGDSRVYLLREGEVVQLTADHIYAADLAAEVDTGRITREEAVSHPERESLTSYLGLDKLPRLDRSRKAFPLMPNDTVLICSDGLYRTLSADDIAESLNKDPRKTCDALVERTIAKHNARQDNVTVIALHCAEEQPVSFRLVQMAAMAAFVAGLLAAAVLIPFHLGFRIGRSSGSPVQIAGGTAAVGPPNAAALGGPAADRRKPVSLAPPARTPAVVPPKLATLPTPSGKSLVTAFDAKPARIRAGDSAVLSWTTKNATGVRIEPDLGIKHLPAAKGEVQVRPASTTTYKIIASGAAIPQSVKRTITVDPALPPALAVVHPTIETFDAVNDGQVWKLRWLIKGAEAAGTNISIDPMIGKVDPSSGEHTVPSPPPDTYTLTVEGPGGKDSKTVTIKPLGQ